MRSDGSNHHLLGSNNHYTQALFIKLPLHSRIQNDLLLVLSNPYLYSHLHTKLPPLTSPTSHPTTGICSLSHADNLLFPTWISLCPYLACILLKFSLPFKFHFKLRSLPSEWNSWLILVNLSTQCSLSSYVHLLDNVVYTPILIKCTETVARDPFVFLCRTHFRTSITGPAYMVSRQGQIAI